MAGRFEGNYSARQTMLVCNVQASLKAVSYQYAHGGNPRNALSKLKLNEVSAGREAYVLFNMPPRGNILKLNNREAPGEPFELREYGGRKLAYHARVLCLA